MLNPNTCRECAAELRGRSDKKFCDDQCRSLYNNRLRNREEGPVRAINAILRRNRTILAGLNTTGKLKIPRSRLVQAGFAFGYHTHTFRNRAGAVYHFVYEQGWLEIGEEGVLLVRGKGEHNQPS
ncbi:MAG: hypothetical protein INR69_10660 [Mucilaginibacter polytrichastri]|nr:hypothetical protein [Mucilaginibacter polytrichastri]